MLVSLWNIFLRVFRRSETWDKKKNQWFLYQPIEVLDRISKKLRSVGWFTGVLKHHDCASNGCKVAVVHITAMAFGTLPPRNNDLAIYRLHLQKEHWYVAFHWSSSVGRYLSIFTFRLDPQTTRFHPVSSWNPFHWGSARYGLFCPCFEVGNLNQTSPKLDHGRWLEKRCVRKVNVHSDFLLLQDSS